MKTYKYVLSVVIFGLIVLNGPSAGTRKYSILRYTYLTQSFNTVESFIVLSNSIFSFNYNYEWCWYRIILMCCRKPAKITGLYWPHPVTSMTLVLLFTLADCSRFCRISSLTRPQYLLYLVSNICTMQDARGCRFQV